ncbi:MAG: hypothetical protein ACK5NK_06450 [Niabella sp.]
MKMNKTDSVINVLRMSEPMLKDNGELVDSVIEFVKSEQIPEKNKYGYKNRLLFISGVAAMIVFFFCVEFFYMRGKSDYITTKHFYDDDFCRIKKQHKNLTENIQEYVRMSEEQRQLKTNLILKYSK